MMEPTRTHPVAVPGLEPHADSLARQALRRNRARATGLLIATGAVFAATLLVEDPGFATRLLRAASEAGIVGGLADWFAVTALFRHPLGLPIPHTAILPNNKDRIGRALGSFVERSFLTPELLLPKVRSSRPARRFAQWLAAPGAGPILIEPIISSLPQVIRSLETPELHEFASRTIGEHLRQADVAPMLGHVIRGLTASGEADVLFERLIEAGHRWLRENRAQIDDLVRQRSRWWIPKRINARMAGAVVDGVTDILDGLRKPDSEARKRFKDALSQLVADLTDSPEQRAWLNGVKDQLLDHPDIQAWLASIWRDLSGMIVADLERPDSRTRTALQSAFVSLGNALAADEAMQGRIDALVEEVTAYAIARREKIGLFIAEVVKSWDASTISDRLELVIGNDLQFIRMNGTVVGAIVGCLIFLFSSLVAPS